MSNLKLLIVSLFVTLCGMPYVVGQQRVLTLDEIFAVNPTSSIGVSV